MNEVRKKLRADYAFAKGLTGRGITVAIMDTGIVMHPDFDNRILKFTDFTQGRKAPYDDNGHGCHVNDWKHEKYYYLEICYKKHNFFL